MATTAPTTDKHQVEPENLLTWVLGSVALVVGALGTAVTTLWSRSESKNAIAIEVLTKHVAQCEEDKKQLTIRVTQCETKLTFLEKKVDGHS